MRRLPDRVRIHPAALSGEVAVTGDKSLSHRCLLIGSLVDGQVEVRGLAPSADVGATAEALRRLGCEIDLGPGADGRLEGVVRGPVMAALPASTDLPVAIDCGNSGTTLRLLAGIIAGSGHHAVLDGDDSLRRRPVDRILAPLRAMGATAQARDDRLPPLEVLPSRLHAARWNSPVASAQIKSCVLLAAAAAGVEAEVRSPHASRDHTERMLRHAGLDVTSSESDDPEGPEIVRITPGPLRLRSLSASRDPSAAAFWHVAAACGEASILTPGLCLNVGRTGALDVLRAMGADVTVTGRAEVDGEPFGDVRVTASRLVGTEVDGALVVRCLDELPVLAIAGAMSADGLEVRDAAELRVKESDRITVLAEALRGMGLVIDERPDGFRVPGGQRATGGHVHAHGDHRIAMTAAVAASLGSGPVEIDGFAAVGTSYPGFLSDLIMLGGQVEVLDG